MLRVLKLISFAFLLAIQFANGQLLSVFETIGTKDGLPSNYIFNVSEDEHGALWAGTDKGLAKFDGYKWHTITADDGLPGNYVLNVNCDGKGGIWLSIGEKGVYYYQITKNKFTKISDELLLQDLDVSRVGDLFISKFDSVKKEVELIQYSAASSLQGKKIFSVKINSNDKQLPVQIFANSKILGHATGSLRHSIDRDWQLKSGPEYQQKLIWYNAKDSIFFHKGVIYIHHNGKVIEKQLFDESGYFYFAHNRYKFYCTNVLNGFYEFDINGNVRHYTMADGLCTSIVNGIYCTKNGNVFISTTGGGLQKLVGETHSSLNLQEFTTKAIACSEGKAYVCSDSKLKIIDIAQNRLLYDFAFDRVQVQGLNVEGNKILIPSIGGANIYEISNGKVQKIRQLINTAGVSSVFTQGRNFIIGTYGDGINTIDEKGNKTSLDRYYKYRITERLLKLDNHFAALTMDTGMQIFDKNWRVIHSLTTANGLPSNLVFHAHSKNDSIWVATSKGIAVYKNYKWLRTLEVDGSPCTYVFHDRLGRFWAVNRINLICYAASGKIVIHKALVKETNEKVGSVNYDVATDKLVYSNGSTLNIINMNSLISTGAVRPPQLVSAYADASTQNLNETFRLPHNFRTISYTVRPAFADPFVQTNILYKLQGYNDRYVALKDSNRIVFEQLRPGTYTLLAKARNELGIDSEEIILSKIIIEKPFWQRWWFIMLCALALVASTYAVFSYLQKLKQQALDKKRELEMTVLLERTRISKDLHDHLGASLVVMMSQADGVETRLKQNKLDDALTRVQKLAEQTRESMNVLRETIWAVQEQSHTLAEFELRIRNFLQRVMDACNINWALDCIGMLDDKLSAEQTLHLFRVVQEVTQNAIKHSGAVTITYKLVASDNHIEIIIADNGKGFDTQKHFAGNGLTNLKLRVEEIGGNLKISSKLGEGTRVNVSVGL
jgi:signal transduction histidine kinase